MQKFKLSGVVQGLIITILGFIADTTLLIMLLYFYNTEKFAFVLLFTVIDIIILITINQLIKEYKNEKKNIN